MDGEQEKKISKPFASEPPSDYEDDEFEDEDISGEEEAGGASAQKKPTPTPATAGATQRGSAEEMVARALEGGMWKEYTQPDTGKKYYHHMVTKKTVWDLAAELGATATEPMVESKEKASPWGADSSLSVVEGYESSNASFQGPSLVLPQHLRSRGSTPSDQGGAGEPSTFAPWAQSSQMSGSTPRTERLENTPREAIRSEDDADEGGEKHPIPASLPSRPAAATTTPTTTETAKTKAKVSTVTEDTDSEFSTASQMIKEVQGDQQQKKAELVATMAKKELELQAKTKTPAAATTSPQTTVLSAPTGITQTEGAGKPQTSLLLPAATAVKASPTTAGVASSGFKLELKLPTSSPTTTTPTTLQTGASAVPTATAATTGVSLGAKPAAAHRPQQEVVPVQQARPPAVIYTDPTALQELTASAEALGHLVKAYKDLKVPPPAAAPYSSPSQPGVIHGAKDGQVGVRSDGGGFSVIADEKPQHRTPAFREWERDSYRTAHQKRMGKGEASYVQRLHDNESLLEEELLDLVMSMLLHAQGGPLPPSSSVQGKKKQKNVKIVCDVAGGQGASEREKVDRYRDYTAKYSAATKQKSSLSTSALPFASLSERTVEFDTFAERGALQRLVEDNLEKYVVTNVRKGKIHPSVARFVLLDALGMFHEVLQYSDQLAGARDNGNMTTVNNILPLFDGAQLVLLSLDCTRLTQRVVELASRVLHCAPCELASAAPGGNAGGASAGTQSPAQKKLLFRIEHWVTRSHLQEVFRAFVTTLREVEGTVFDIETMSMTAGSGRTSLASIQEVDEADLAACISPILSLFVPQVTGTPSDEPKQKETPAAVVKPVQRQPTTSSYGFKGEESERILFAAQAVATAARETLPDMLGGDGSSATTVDSAIVQESVTETVDELLADSSIREAMMRRIAGKYVKKTEAKKLTKTDHRAMEKAKRDAEVQKEIETQVDRVLDRIRYEVEMSTADAKDALVV